MGVSQFFKIVINNAKSRFHKKTISEIGEQVSLSKFRGERLCDDASLTIYSSILALESVQTLTDKEGRTTAHINTIFNKIIQRIEFGIVQIWIFDSPEPNPLKRLAAERRQARREKTDAFRITAEHVADIQTLLRLMGIMYIVAPPGIEAEQYGAYLTTGPDRFCKYMISGDSDVLMFGGNLLRSFTEKSATGKTKKTVYQTFDLDEVLAETGLSYEEFLEVGVALGTDFNEANEQGIAARTIMRKRKDIFITPAMRRTIEYYRSSIENVQAEIVESKFDRAGVIEFLVSRGFNAERVTKRLSSLAS